MPKVINTQPWIIDVEASGFGAESYPIEIGVAFEDGRKYCTLIAPAADWTHWDEEAEKVHRVSRDILETYGRPIIDVTHELNELLSDKTVYTDGWVVDKPWILKLFYYARTEPSFNTSSLEMILSEDQMAIWHETKDQLNIELGSRRHRASYDAFLIQQTWLKTKDLVTETN